jgi:hypothetical protein
LRARLLQRFDHHICDRAAHGALLQVDSANGVTCARVYNAILIRLKLRATAQVPYSSLAREGKTIRKYYGRSIVALLLIPVVTVAAAGIDYMIDPELARGHPNYVRNFALLQHLRFGVVVAALVLVITLWLLACLWQLRAKSQRRSW